MQLRQESMGGCGPQQLFHVGGRSMDDEPSAAYILLPAGRFPMLYLLERELFEEWALVCAHCLLLAVTAFVARVSRVCRTLPAESCGVGNLV